MAKEKFKTWGNVFDQFTQKTLFKLISQGHFDGLESPISVGKESNVFSALTDDGKVMVKIYRLEACDFNRMYDYIKYDYRYDGLRKQSRKIIFAWTQREYRNLVKAREANVSVPTPIVFLNNVLVLEHIGKDIPAPKLKDCYPRNPGEFLDETTENLRKLYMAGFVHADISAFNILNDDERPVLIDFSQGTPIRNPRAMEFLKRDVRNLCNFFKKNGHDTDESRVLKKIISQTKNLKRKEAISDKKQAF